MQAEPDVNPAIAKIIQYNCASPTSYMASKTSAMLLSAGHPMTQQEVCQGAANEHDCCAVCAASAVPSP